MSTSDNSDTVAAARRYLETGGVGEVAGMAEMVKAHGLPKVQMDTDMAIALCQMAAEPIEPRSSRSVR